ncbi:MAG: hypothetical protein ACKVP5_01970 [Aestuariivirga sp.]
MANFARLIGHRFAKRVAMRALRHSVERLGNSALHGMGVTRTDIESVLAAGRPNPACRCFGSAVCQIEAPPLG